MAIWSSGVRGESAPEATVYVDRGVLAYDDGHYENALKEFEVALRLNPESVDALYYQGLAYAALNRFSDAESAFDKALRVRPGDPDVAFQLGVLYFNQQRYERAEPLLRQVYRNEPRRENLGYYLGFIEYRKRNYREALAFLQAAAPSDENFAQLTRFYSGLAMGALGFPREARAEVEEAVRAQPVSPLTAPAQRFGELLQRAEERERFFRGELKTGIFYDTNVPVVPNVSSDLVGETIRDQQGRQKSEGELVSLDLAYTWLRTLDWEGTVSHRFFQTYNNHLTEFNTQSNTPTVSLVNRGEMRSPFGNLPYFAGLQMTYDFITLGNARFTQRWIFNPYLTLAANARNLTTLQYRFQWKDFFNDRKVERREVRDAKNYMVGPLHFFLFDGGRHYVKLGYQYDAELAEGENWSYWGNRLLFGGQYTLPWWDIRLRYDLEYHWRFHKHRHSLVPVTAVNTVKRRDREAVHLFAIARDFVFAERNFTLAVEYLFDDNTSNLKPFDYERHVVITSLAWRF